MRSVFLAISLIACHQAAAWSDHASLAWPMLRTDATLMQSRVVVEPLDVFLKAEAAGIADVLARLEIEMIEGNPEYPPTPVELTFNGSNKTDFQGRFIAALRISPRLDYGLYRQVMAGDVISSEAKTLGWSDLSYLPSGDSVQERAYLPLTVGALVSPAYILASASDEPDLGMDVGLYSDNDTDVGARYGLGEQPFGNPNLPYGSQAPLHMGFYHLDAVTQLAQPSLKRTLPLWRIKQYEELARLAFATGHEYWGWRFMGWALHYVGDLTQPYHTDPLPGVDLLSALWSVVMGETNDLIQLVSNRHGVLESYQYRRVLALMQEGAWQAPLLLAISEPQTACFTPEGVVSDLTAQSVALGPGLDETLSKRVPALYVSDPAFEWVGYELEADVVALINAQGGDSAIEALDNELERHLRRFSYYLQGWITHTRTLELGAG
ncbi:MAG: hypothetical protein P8H66_08015 [Luminiphilus sp.]|nr:hypothetical protein [Luminiphilus sp.]